MITIPLGSNKYPGLSTVIDDEDLPLVSPHAWSVLKGHKTFYAVTNIERRQVLMRRLSKVIPPGLLIDHEDRDGLNNRRYNLREATQSQNQANRAPQKNKSGYYGVRLTPGGRYVAKIVIRQVSMYLGTFTDPREAASVYDDAALWFYGAFARLNFPEVSR